MCKASNYAVAIYREESFVVVCGRKKGGRNREKKCSYTNRTRRRSFCHTPRSHSNLSTNIDLYIELHSRSYTPKLKCACVQNKS